MTEAQPQTAPPPGARAPGDRPRDCRRPRRAARRETERERRLPDALVARLRDSGLMRAGAPARGRRARAARPASALRCAEEIARGDASAGWCVSIAIDQQPARRLPARPRAATSCSATGERIAAGRVGAARQGAGRSTAASSSPAAGRSAAGSRHADLLFAGCIVDGGDDADGARPMPRVVAHPARTSSRSSTPGTRSACAAPAATTPSPTRCSCPPRACSRCSTARSSTARCTASRSSGSSRCRSRAAALGNARGAIDDLVALAAGKVGHGLDAARSPSARRRRPRSPRPRPRCAPRGRCTTRRSTPPGTRPRATSRCRVDAAQRPAPGGHPRRAHVGRRRARDVRPRRRHGDLRRLAAPAPLPRRPHRHRALPGQRGLPRAPRPDPARAARRHRDAVSRRVEGVLPFWLDRPDDEALDIAARGPARRAAARCGSARWRPSTPFALATAVGQRAPGPAAQGRAAGDRRPQPGRDRARASSVATLTGSRGRRRARRLQPGDRRPAGTTASGRTARRAHAGDDRLPACDPRRRARPTYDGRHVRTHGFRLRRPLPDTRISVAAFGPAMTRVAARHADEVVLNLVPPEHVARGARDRRRRGRGGGPHRRRAGGLGAGRAGAGRRGARPARLAARGLPRRRPGTARCSPRSASATSSSAPARAPGAPSWRDAVPLELLEQVVRARAPPTRSPPASRRTTTPAPTSSASCPRPPRTRAAGRRRQVLARAASTPRTEELAP